MTRYSEQINHSVVETMTAETVGNVETSLIPLLGETAFDM